MAARWTVGTWPWHRQTSTEVSCSVGAAQTGTCLPQQSWASPLSTPCHPWSEDLRLFLLLPAKVRVQPPHVANSHSFMGLRSEWSERQLWQLSWLRAGIPLRWCSCTCGQPFMAFCLSLTTYWLNSSYCESRCCHLGTSCRVCFPSLY